MYYMLPLDDGWGSCKFRLIEIGQMSSAQRSYELRRLIGWRCYDGHISRHYLVVLERRVDIKFGHDSHEFQWFRVLCRLPFKVKHREEEGTFIWKLEKIKSFSKSAIQTVCGWLKSWSRQWMYLHEVGCLQAMNRRNTLYDWGFLTFAF